MRGEERLLRQGRWAEASVRELLRLFGALFAAVTLHYLFCGFLRLHDGFSDAPGRAFVRQLTVSAGLLLAGFVFRMALRVRAFVDAPSPKAWDDGPCRRRRLLLRFLLAAASTTLWSVFASVALVFTMGQGSVGTRFLLPWLGTLLLVVLPAAALGMHLSFRLDGRRLGLLHGVSGTSCVVALLAGATVLSSWPLDFLMGARPLERMTGFRGWELWRFFVSLPGIHHLEQGMESLSSLPSLLAVLSGAALLFLLLVLHRSWARLRDGEGGSGPIEVVPFWRRLGRRLLVGSGLALAVHWGWRIGAVEDSLWWVELAWASVAMLPLAYVLAGRVLGRWSSNLLRFLVTGDGEGFLWRAYGAVVAVLLGTSFALLAALTAVGHLQPRQAVFAFFTLFQASFASTGLALWFRASSALGGRRDWAERDLLHGPGYLYLAASLAYLTPILATDGLLVKAFAQPGVSMRIMVAWFAMKVVYAFAGLFFTVVIPMESLEGSVHGGAFVGPRKLFRGGEALSSPVPGRRAGLEGCP